LQAAAEWLPDSAQTAMIVDEGDIRSADAGTCLTNMPFPSHVIDLEGSDLREAQVGALHAVAAHFSWSDDSAQIVLPTGVGKTVVATLLPYLLRTEQKVLVVAPARIVRDQLIHEFKTLETGKAVGALPADTPPPSVYPAIHRMTDDDWAGTASFDVIIGTPHVLSSANPGVAPLDPKKFGLVIFDEAHHLPAPTWTSLYGDLDGIKRVLLTATLSVETGGVSRANSRSLTRCAERSRRARIDQCGSLL
jgi:superfamily II DNA or RNA helicase